MTCTDGWSASERETGGNADADERTSPACKPHGPETTPRGFFRVPLDPSGMRTVFHHSDSAEHDHVLANVENLLDDDSVEAASIAVVANADGVYLLDAEGEYADRVRGLLEEDVEFVACENSLASRDLTPDDLIDGIDTAESGVGELTRRQGRGYAYVKP